jgi:hypothetical protein
VTAEQRSEPALPPAPARWTGRLATAAIVGIALVVALGIGARLSGRPQPLHVILGLFLACFAALKFAVATDAVLRLREVREREIDPRDTYGSRGMAVGWVAYKYVAAAVAVFATIYVFTTGAERVDRLFGG